MRLNVPTQLVAAATVARCCRGRLGHAAALADRACRRRRPRSWSGSSSFHDLLLWIIIADRASSCSALLVYACWRFGEKRNPVPSRRSHNTLLEIVWTAVPVLILVIIAIPSFKLLYFMDVMPETELTIKATGHQWYWSYDYPDNGNFTFDANMIADQRPAAGPAAPARDRQSAGGTGRHQRPHPDHRRRRDPQLGACRSSASRSTRSRAA